MNTIFGVLNPASSSLEFETYLEVAQRSGIGKDKVSITWLNPLAILLSDDMKVIPLDNSAQGIETIGDLKRLERNG